ncbi:MAG: response regulator [Spirochaetota bacterium]
MYKLLIADDELIERDALRYIITGSCGRIEDIRDACNGREALAAALEWQPDIVLMDVKMPGINGVEAARELHEQLPETRLVFLTAYDYFDYAREAIRIGADDFLVKPANDERVMEVIGKICDDLDREQAQRERLQADARTLQQVRLMLERELVTGISTGTLSEGQIQEHFEVMGLDRPERYLSYAVSAEIHFDSYPTRIDSDSQKRVLARRCAGEIAACFNEHGYLAMTAYERNTVTLLALVREPGSEGNIHDSALACQRRVSRKFALSIRIGLDPESRPPTSAYRGFRYACVARASAPSARRDNPETGGDRYPYEAEHGFYEAVSGEDREAALSAAQAAVDRLAADCRDPVEIRRRLIEMITVVARQLDFAPWDVQYDGISVLERLETAETLPDFQAIMREAALSLHHERRSFARAPSHLNLERVRTHLEEHFAENITLADAAALARVSQHHFSRAFKAHTGMTFVDYLNSFRIARAKTLLHNSDMSIKEISSAVGFTDPNYFSRVFKQHNHLTASQFRSKSLLP